MVGIAAQRVLFYKQNGSRYSGKLLYFTLAASVLLILVDSEAASVK